MIIGNEKAQKVLKQYIERYQQAGGSQAAFFLLHGPSNVGKSTIATQCMQDVLGVYAATDGIIFKDFSDFLHKQHTIRVEENTTTEDYKSLQDKMLYQDLGIREINRWLQQSSFGGYKMLIIENIERMTNEAANAFLKTCEEPLAKRIIIATTGNKSKVLETIQSRAIHIPFSSLSDEEMKKIYLPEIQSEKELYDMLLAMAMGRPGMLKKIVEIVQSDEDTIGLLKKFLPLFSSQGKIGEKHRILLQCEEKGMLGYVIDGLISYLTFHHRIHDANIWMKVKQIMQGNVSAEQALLYGILEQQGT